MTAAKRALLYLTRKKGRSLLLILIIFIMSSFIMVGTALKTSADKEAEKIRQNLGTGFVIQLPIDDERYYQSIDEGVNQYVGPHITQSTVDNILNLENVIDYSADFGNVFVGTDLILRPGAWSDLLEEGDTDYTEEEYQAYMKQGYPTVCENGELHKSFRTGALSIIDGRNIRNEDRHTAVISEYLAEKNNLEIGDTFTVEATDDINTPATTGEPIKLEIVGIFRANLKQEPSPFTVEIQYIDNFIFIDLDTGTEINLMASKAYCDAAGIEFKEKDHQLSFNDVTFFVDDPQELDSVMQKVEKDIGLEEGLILTRDDTAYQASVRPLKTISILAMILLLIGSMGCMIILVLLLTMWIKSRKREIGILISIGISKGKIVLQMVLECILVSAAGLALTLVLSGITINGCCEIAEHMTQPSQTQQEYSVRFNKWIQPVIDKVSADAVRLEYDYSARDAILLIIAVCGISSGSVLAASRQIMKMEPQSLFQTL